MQIAPKDIYEKLEFDKILEIVETYCFGELGKQAVRNLPVYTKEEDIERALQEVFEYTQTYEHKHNFPISVYREVNEDLKMLGIEGYVLSVESLRNIGKILLLTQAIYNFFMKRKDAKELYPTLLDIIRVIDFDEELLTEIRKVIDDEGNIRPDASPELMRIARMQSSKQQELTKAFKRIIQVYQSQGKLTDNVESIRNGRRVLAVPAEYKRQVRGIIHDESATGKTVFIEPETVIDINNDIFNLEQEYKREIYRILRALSATLRPYIEHIREYQSILVRFDVVQAKAQLANTLDATKPKLFAKPHFKLTKAIHPLLYLKNKREGHKTIPFDLHFRKHNRILVLSGPNAGGKSICMKAIGLIQLMAQAGMLIPVEEGSEIGMFDQVFADIGDQQSLEDELSTYSSRLQNARVFMEKANEKTFVLIDEFGSGTDPKMGGAIAESILKDLNSKNVFGVITTHYSNLKVYAHENEGLVNGAMVFDKDTLSPTYHMRIGRPGSSYAFEIATKSGLPKKVISYARKKTGKQEHTMDELLVELQRERQKATEAHKSLLEQQKRLDQLIKNYDYANRELEFGRKKLKLKIKEQELVDNQNAHKELQKVLKELKEAENVQKAAARAKALLEETQEKKEKARTKVDGIKDDIYKVYDQKTKGTIETGSHVRMREGGAMGIVKELKRKEAVVEMGNITLTIKLRDLQLIPNPIELTQKATVKTNTINKQARFESKIDVRGLRYDEALDMIQDFLDEALMANSTRVEIIHGKGSGVLRKAVHHKVKEYPNIKNVYHPEANRGGDGLTVIEFE
ncbi:MAG: endonuclease MutS2 [Aureispira sp.]|nr:endonuclease MutS2 [Aureispira sp.]